MKYLQSAYNGNHDELIIKPLGDLHIGAPNFDEKVFTRELEKIDKERDRTRIILMGDLAETATKESVGAGVYEQRDMVDQQIYKAKNLLWDFRDLIDLIVTGNHEQRVYKQSGHDPMRYFAELMGLADKYARYQGVVKYAWNKRAYDVAVWHGAGGGTTIGGAMNKLQKMQNVVVADVYLMGHVHKRAATFDGIYITDQRNGKIIQKKQAFVITGSALGYEESYAEEAGLKPSIKGFPSIYLDGTFQAAGNSRQVVNKDIRVEI